MYHHIPTTDCINDQEFENSNNANDANVYHANYNDSDHDSNDSCSSSNSCRKHPLMEAIYIDCDRAAANEKSIRKYQEQCVDFIELGLLSLCFHFLCCVNQFKKDHKVDIYRSCDDSDGNSENEVGIFVSAVNGKNLQNFILCI